MLEFPGEGVNLRKFSAKICVLGSLCHLSSVPLSTPRSLEPSKTIAVTKFGIRGVFECCKGSEGSQLKADLPLTLPLQTLVLIVFAAFAFQGFVNAVLERINGDLKRVI